MSLMVKGIPVTILVGMVLLIVGGLLHIVGLATPYWHTVTISNTLHKNIPYAHRGLWMDCANINEDFTDCNEHSDVKGFLVATRAFVVLALLMGIVCMCVTGIWFFLDIKRFNLVFMISSLGTGFCCGLFGIIGIIIYAADINSQDRQNTVVGQRTDTSLSWSFALCTLSACIGVIAVILIAIGIRMRER